MAESKFKNIQEDVCFKSPEEEEALEPDKICPTCIPNQNYIEPDWTQLEEPYLNEKKCEYQVKVVINIDAEVYHDGQSFKANDVGSRVFTKLSDSPYDFNTLLKSYIRPGIRKMLRFYGKLETDQIVCAAPPESQGQICKGIFGSSYEEYVIRTERLTDEIIPQTFETIDINEQILIDNPEITNMEALELVARAQDYTFITNQKVLIVLVGVPAYRFDAVPNAPDLGSLNTSTDQIVIKPPEFMPDIGLFISAMKSFKTFQAYFYKEENAKIYFQESGNPFYVKFYAEERISKFVNKLDKLLDNNGFDLRGFLDTGDDSFNIAFEIEVSFDKTDEANPFVVKNVRARKKNCPYIECKKGLNSFIEYSKSDQTMMGYFSNIKNIATTLQANKTPPWLDFIVDNTFPQLAINYGSSDNFEDNSCLSVNLDDLSDFILEETMDLFKSIEYSFSQNKCKTKEEMLAKNAEIQDYFSGDPDSVKKIKELQKAWSYRKSQVNKVKTGVQVGFKTGVKGAKKLVTKGPDFKAMGQAVATGAISAKLAISEMIENLDTCDFKGKLGIAIKCLAAALTLDEVYYTLIKQIISSAGEQALEVIMQTLPANKQEAIRKEVEKQFKDMPFPWDPGWEGGSLGKAVDRQARSDVEEDLEKRNKEIHSNQLLAEIESMSLNEKIVKIEERLAELKDPAFFDQYINNMHERVDPYESEIAENLSLVTNYSNLIQSNDSQALELQSELSGLQSPFVNDLDEALALQEQLRIQLGYEEIYKLEDKGAGVFSITGKKNGETVAQTVIVDDYLDTSYNEDYRREEQVVALLEQLQTDTLYLTSKVVRLEERNVTLTSLVDDVFNQETFQTIQKEEINLLTSELEKIKAKKFESDTTAQDLNDYRNFENLSEEDQQEIVDKQKEKTTIVATTPSDKIQQGTLGKALGNVQKALTQAYIDEIMKTASIGELQRAIENIPGADLLGKLVSRFKCGSDPLVYPPIESFLSTLTFDPCRGGKSRISLPTIQEIPTSFNWMEQLGDAFYVALREILSRVLIAMMVKTTQLLSTDLCKLTGNLTRNLLNDGGIEGFITDTLCPDPKTNDQKDKINKQVAGAGGAGAKGGAAVADLVTLLSVSATQKEIKQAMTGQGDPSFLANISSLVKNVLPQFADIFADPTSAAQYFETMGNILTAEQRQNIIDELDSPLADYPVETSICLTKEQKDLWDQERIAAFSDPELGEEFVRKQDEKTKSDLADAANLLINGPDQLLQDAIDEAFNPKDPDCKTSKGIIPSFSDYPQNQQQAISNAITGIFKRLEKAFIDDTIEWNAFSSLFGFNTPGILSMILANRTNKELNWHLLIKNNPILNVLFGGDEVLPETVAIQLKDYIESQVIDYKLGKDTILYYNNNKEGFANYDSSLSINDTFDPDGKISIADQESNIQIISDNFLEIPEKYEPNQGEVSFQDPFGSLTLRKMIEDIWSQFSDITIESNTIFEGMNADLYDKLPKTFTVRRNGISSEGFLYGNEDQPILEETDLVYVGPNGEEYDYEESEKVLGRSKTNNPRVYFLDPQKYGGTYRKPQIYISEAQHKGWLQFSKIIVPNPTGCDPKNSNFLMLDTLIQDIDKNKQKIQNHELLQYSPECTSELPFDKIANSDTLATIEGIVRATIRIHLSDFLIRSFPIFSNVHLEIERNYDNIALNYITEKIYDGLTNETAIFASTYEGYTYALLFLEQVVQIVHRKVRNEQMESNQEIEEILEICDQAQQDYEAITTNDLLKMKTNGIAEFIEDVAEHVTSKLGSPQQFEVYTEEVERKIEVVKAGAAILSGKGKGFDLLSFFESATFNIAFISLEQARFASKIYSIDSVAEDIKKLLKYVVKEEMDLYTKILRESIEPRPYIYDIRKFFIGGSHMLLGKQIEAGTYDSEVPIGGGIGNFPYGDINDCAKLNMVHPLNGATITDDRFEEIKERGGFYLEKYIVSQPKTDSRFGIVNPISGIQNLAEFKQFLNQNRLVFDPTHNVSDYFGDAVLSENETEYEGSIGIKYGVRLCYIPPTGYNPFDSLVAGLNAVPLARDHRSYVLNPASFETDSGTKLLESSRYSFPICSYEQDILDVKIEELLTSNDNLNQDLKCYIDKLVKTENYKHLVDNVLQITKIPSTYLIYSYINLLPSLGSESERNPGDDDNIIAPDRIGKLFNDSKSEARKLFVAFYKNNDRDPPSEEENNEDIVKHAQRALTNSLKFLNIGEYSWDLKRRIKPDSPLDKDGNLCENNFGKLFKKRGL